MDAAQTKAYFTAKPPTEVPLECSPLVFVACSIQFPSRTELQGGTVPPVFAQRLASDYPSMNVKVEQSVNFGPGLKEVRTAEQRLWEFTSADGNWSVALTGSYVELRTFSYSSRSDFVARVDQVWQALRAAMEISAVTRHDVRFVNRLIDVDPAQLQTYMRSEILGAIGACNGSAVLMESLHANTFELDEGKFVMARSGWVPPGVPVAPDLPGVDDYSWMLDIVAFRQEPRASMSEGIADSVSELADAAYQYFRWSVTDELLKACGGAL